MLYTIRYIEPDQLSVVCCMQEDMAGRQLGEPCSNPDVTPTPTDSPLIQQMAQAMTPMIEAQGQEDRYQSFRRHDPPTFSGKGIPW
jgi:hypothetical protein